MPSAEIAHDLLQYLEDQIASGDLLKGETDLLNSGILDSLLLLDVVAHIERRWNVVLEPADLEPKSFQSVLTIAELVARKQAAATLAL